ncbi:MAG: hypothetical protein U0800_03350 [Isosphaeraceae bacterium]
MRLSRVALLALAMAPFANGLPAPADVVVNTFAPFSATPTAGVWYQSGVASGGVASIVDLTGAGGNLEFNQPLPPGAAKLTTDGTIASRAEVGVQNDFGLAGTVLNALSLNYTYYKKAGGDPTPAPSLKLRFFNFSTGGFTSLVYEPYQNLSGPVPTDTWTTVSINSTTGTFWTTGGFGQPNGNGGGTQLTLSGWLSQFNSGFAGATLYEVAIGLGSNNPNQVGYFDKVVIDGSKQANVTYNFQPVPEPSTLALGGLAMGLGVAAAAARRRAAKAPLA